MTDTSILSVLLLLASLIPFASAAINNNASPTPIINEGDVRAALEQAKALLEEPLPPIHVDDGDQNADMENLRNSIQGLEDALTQELQPKQAKVEELLRVENAKQLQSFMGRLQATHEQERQLRNFVQAQMEKLGADGLNVVEEEDEEDTIPPEDIVTLEMLRQRLDPNVIAQGSEQELMAWMKEIVEEELEKYKAEMLEPVVAISGKLGGGGASTSSSAGACPGTPEIVQKVQQSLNDYANDGIGKKDHAQGAKVVHSLTTNTYKPDVEDALGEVWWRRYIPQDWEELLPEGWEDWSVPGLPSYLYHSVVSGNVIVCCRLTSCLTHIYVCFHFLFLQCA